MNRSITNCNLKYNNLVLILGLAGFISAADNWFVSPALAPIASEFSISVSVAGIILTSYMIPYGVMQPVYGFFSDKWSKVSVLKIIVGGLAVGTVGSAFARGLLLMCLFRVITGFFAAGIIAVSLALIGDIVPTVERQVYVGKFMGIVFLGQGLSAGLGGLITKYISWRGAFVFFGVVAAISDLILIKELSNDLTKTSVNNKANNFFLKTKIAICTPIGRKIFPLALIAGFLLLGLYSYLGSFLHDLIHLDYLECGLIIMFYGFACLIGGTKVGKFSRKYGKKNIILLGAGFALITALLLYFFHYWEVSLIATIFLGFGYICIQSTLATMAFDVTPESTGLPSGLIGLGLFGGGGLGSLFSGWLLSVGGYGSIWIIFAIALVIFVLIITKLKFN
ncbi:MFS transporter [Clostridium felsineum]|uniref:MFS transporter n=1 Tax=Clostridium felsineum TaxID=36839 RepID=UPI00214D6E24|nr:MFS transporter [Clostridium felsineum]MCR3760053.1 MFS transporter [Clostridium felsineum]